MGALSFNETEIDALGEMMNISLGASATAMSTLLGSTVHITTPKVKILTRDQFEFKKLEPAVGVEITTNARTIIWHQFCFLLFFKLLKVLLDTELGVS